MGLYRLLHGEHISTVILGYQWVRCFSGVLVNQSIQDGKFGICINWTSTYLNHFKKEGLGVAQLEARDVIILV